MIGQTELLHKIDTLADRNFPHFVILTGGRGCGKRTVSKYIAKKINANYIPCGIKADDVRKVIDLCYSQIKPTLYVFPDCEGMSVAAKNSLLKVTEEPPQRSYFIMTAESSGSILPTLLSRGTSLSLDPYTQKELQIYTLKKHPEATDKQLEMINTVCSTTGEIDTLFKFNIDEFYENAEIVATKIHVPTTGNIFKISKLISLKEGDDGYDPVLFFRLVASLFFQMGKANKKPQYFEAVKVTYDAIKDLQHPSIANLGTADMWIINVRKALRGI